MVKIIAHTPAGSHGAVLIKMSLLHFKLNTYIIDCIEIDSIIWFLSQEVLFGLERNVVLKPKTFLMKIQYLLIGSKYSYAYVFAIRNMII